MIKGEIKIKIQINSKKKFQKNKIIKTKNKNFFWVQFFLPGLLFFIKGLTNFIMQIQ
jgi:hypothetical protein